MIKIFTMLVAGIFASVRFSIYEGNSTYKFDGSILALSTVLLTLIIMLARAFVRLENLRGKVVVFPKSSSSFFDRLWISLLPSLVCYRYVNQKIIHGGDSITGWELDFGQSPFKNYLFIAVAVLIITIRFISALPQTSE